MRLEGVLTDDDSKRLIRYLDTAPISMPLDTGEALSHDVERYCAFRQDLYLENEARKDESVGSLQKAREARLKVLDSIDKYGS